MADCCFEFIDNKNNNQHRNIKRNEMKWLKVKKKKEIFSIVYFRILSKKKSNLIIHQNTQWLNWDCQFFLYTSINPIDMYCCAVLCVYDKCHGS